MADGLPFDAKDGKKTPCPICGKQPSEDVAPFCSKRCADVDLHRWLGGVYAVPDDAPGGADLSSEDEL